MALKLYFQIELLSNNLFHHNYDNCDNWIFILQWWRHKAKIRPTNEIHTKRQKIVGHGVGKLKTTIIRDESIVTGSNKKKLISYRGAILGRWKNRNGET